MSGEDNLRTDAAGAPAPAPAEEQAHTHGIPSTADRTHGEVLQQRSAVAALLMRKYEELDRLERLLASLRMGPSATPGSQVGPPQGTGHGTGTAGDGETPNLRGHIGNALAMVLRTPQGVHRGAGDPIADLHECTVGDGDYAGAESGIPVLKDVQRNLLALMEILGGLLFEVSVQEAEADLEAIIARAISAMSTFSADPAAPAQT